MSAECCDHENDSEDKSNASQIKFWQVRELQLSFVAIVILMIGFVLERAEMELASSAFALLAGAIAGWTFIPGSIKKVFKRKVGVGTLMTIAFFGALILGQFEEAAALAVLFSISEGLEEFSLTKAQQSLRALLSLVPETAIVKRDNVEIEIPATEVLVDDIFIVKPGSKVPTDGIILEGKSSINISAITGESRVVRIVEDAQSQKGNQQRLADKIAQPLVPGVLLVSSFIALIGSLFGDPEIWIERALVVLVAASPCALAIAVPITVVSAIGAASKFGVIIKGGAALESLGHITNVALDKTGTLTKNEPVVIKVITNNISESEVLEIAAALEARSEHPLAAAIVAASPNPINADNVTAVTGSGITGVVENKAIRLGRPGWIDPGVLKEQVIELQEAGATTVLVEQNGTVIGAIAVRDELREEAIEVIEQLKNDKKNIVMLTGDNKLTALAIANAANITDVKADLKPEDKSRIISELESTNRTAMVGDGVNDAPALATASVGIAMGAIETADVALMGQDLRALPAAFIHAQRSRKIMVQNIGLSLLIIISLLPLALFGIVGLAAVVAIHEVAEVLVILNGLRIARAKVGFHDHSIHHHSN